MSSATAPAAPNGALSSRQVPRDVCICVVGACLVGNCVVGACLLRVGSEQQLRGHCRTARTHHRSPCGKTLQPAAQRIDVGDTLQQIHLVHHQQVRGRELAANDVGHPSVIGLAPHLLGVGHHHHSIQSQARRVAVGSDLRRVGHPAGLDEQTLRRCRGGTHGVQRRREPVSQTAANAAVGERQLVAVGCCDEVLVDGDLAEVVDDHRNPLAAGPQHMVHQRRLAGTQVSADDGDPDSLLAHRAGTATQANSAPCTFDTANRTDARPRRPLPAAARLPARCPTPRCRAVPSGPHSAGRLPARRSRPASRPRCCRCLRPA